MRVLDVGAGGGWFAFYFEQAGAEVTTVDARGYCDFDVYGRFTYPPPPSEKSAPERYSPEGRPIYYSPVSGAFWVIRDLLGSQVKYVNSRVYDVRPELFEDQTFDLVFMGALLLHLRDPIGALMAARSVCRDRIITTTLSIEEDIDNPHPMMDLPYTHLDKISWWRPNKACYKHWLRAAGFEGDVNVERTVPLTGDVPRQRLPSGKANDLVNKTTILRIGEARIG